MRKLDCGNLNGPQRGIISDAIADLFQSEAELNVFMVRNGFWGVAFIGTGLPLQVLVFNLVEKLNSSGDLEQLVDLLFENFPRAPALQGLFGKLRVLASSARTPAEPATFPADEDALERIVRKGGFISPLVLAEKLVRLTNMLCLVRLDGHDGQTFGTGFLVGRDLVLTAYHVVEALDLGRAHRDSVKLVFGFAETYDGMARSENVGLASDGLVARQPYSHADLGIRDGAPTAGELDFALLRISRTVGEERGWVKLAEAAGGSEGEIVIILQHPEGGTARQSFGWLTADRLDHRLRYNANTLNGSSGGLVLNEALRPLALHHAGDPDGKLQARYNQGVPLTEIYRALETVLGP